MLISIVVLALPHPGEFFLAVKRVEHLYIGLVTIFLSLSLHAVSKAFLIVKKVISDCIVLQGFTFM